MRPDLPTNWVPKERRAVAGVRKLKGHRQPQDSRTRNCKTGSESQVVELDLPPHTVQSEDEGDTFCCTTCWYKLVACADRPRCNSCVC